MQLVDSTRLYFHRQDVESAAPKGRHEFNKGLPVVSLNLVNCSGPENDRSKERHMLQKLPTAHFNTFLLLCCWRLWKHRHDVAFRSLSPCYTRLMAGCREDAELWSCRLPHSDRHVSLAWVMVFSSSPPL